MRKIYCTNCTIYKELLHFSICNTCGSEDEKIFKEDESFKILKFLHLIANNRNFCD